MTVRAVVFDLYETLVTEFRARDRRLDTRGTAAQQLGIDPGRLRAGLAAHRRDRFVLGRRYSDVLADICQDVGVEAQRTLLDRIEAQRMVEKARPFAQVDERIVQLLVELRSRGLATAIISNVSPEECMAYPGSVLSGLVDAAVFSCEVGYAKPSSEIYEMTCDGLNVSPDGALFVGDGGSNELEGAAKVGMRPIWATWFSEQWAQAGGYKLEIPTVDHTRARLPLDLLAVIDHPSEPSGR